jgi:tetratricopeptide (TPR) repeat protein
MDAARWARQWEVFHEALTQPPEVRGGWAAARCADDPELADAVRGLLAAHAAEATPLDRPPSAAPVAVVPEAFGPWRVRREIGRGGMGRVLEVERTDGEYAQRAALKLIDPLFAYGVAVERFLRERQLLARLRHPRIARLLDGGRTADGQPWLVMDYVEGEPIDAWCRRHRADLRARLRLLADVCEVVDFAHRQLVLHRDLKPGNVLVGADGQPVLLDFGIARSLDAADPGATAAGESRPLTVAYASPEQLDGSVQGVASDVYALGVLVFEVLAGVRPHEAAGLSWTELAERLRAAPPPSLRARTGTRDLPRELDWICTRALQPDPAARYPSAQALADDLRALLAHRPVAARAPSTRYVVGKFVRRRWPWLAVAAVFAITVGGLVWRLSREAEATRVALTASETERDRAQRVAAFLGDLFRLADTTQAGGRVVPAREILDRGRAQLDARTDLPPDARARLQVSLAEVYRNMGDYANAEQLLGGALPHLDPGSAYEAEALEQLGATRELAGRSQLAREPLERALALRRAASPPDPQAIARAAERLAATLQTLGDREAAGTLFAQAWATRRASAADDDPARADGALRYGSWFWVAGRLAEAAPLYAEALAIRRRQRPPDLPELARTLDANAALAHAQGRIDAALPLYAEALDLRRRALGDAHRLTADSLSNLGAARFDAGDPHGAEAPLREALTIYAAVLPADSVVPAKTHNNLGLVLQARGDLEGARVQFARALALHRASYGPRHARVAGNLNNLALVLERQGELAGAEAALREAASIIAEAQGAAHVSLGFPWTNLGRLRLWADDASTAARLLEQALQVRQAALPAGHALLADTLQWLGAARCATGERSSADAAFAQARTIREASGDADALQDLDALRVACDPGSRGAEAEATLGAWRARRGAQDRLVRWVGRLPMRR